MACRPTVPPRRPAGQ